MGVQNVEAFGDSLLVVQQVSKVYQCYNGSLKAYLGKCLDIISSLDEFFIRHIQGKRMDMLMLWLSKHLVTILRNSTSTFESRCEQKPSCRFWINRSDRSCQSV
jgi:hypothetical protein